MQINTHQFQPQRYLVYDVDSGEILDDNAGQGYPDKKTALATYVLRHNQHRQIDTPDLTSAVNSWWDNHPDIKDSIEEIKLEEAIIKSTILDYQTFRKSLLHSGYQKRIPIRNLYETTKTISGSIVFTTSNRKATVQS